MSQILARHLKCKLGKSLYLSIPWAQVLHLKRGNHPDTKADSIEIRLSVGEVVFYGPRLEALWRDLVSGALPEFTVGKEHESKEDGATSLIESYSTTLDSDMLQPVEPEAESQPVATKSVEREPAVA